MPVVSPRAKLYRDGDDDSFHVLDRLTFENLHGDVFGAGYSYQEASCATSYPMLSAGSNLSHQLPFAETASLYEKLSRGGVLMRTSTRALHLVHALKSTPSLNPRTRWHLVQNIGMVFTFCNDKVSVNMPGFVNDLLDSGGTQGAVTTPATNDLFSVSKRMPVIPV